jgi:type I restriction enzyme S subunit
LTTDEYQTTGDHLLVTGTDFEAGRVEWSRCPHVDAERYAEDPYIQLREDDLLITKDGTIGKVAIVRNMPKPATLNSGVFVTRGIEK